MSVPAEFPHFVSAAISCGYCEEKAGLYAVAVPAGDCVPEPTLPDGWHLFDRVPVCPNHRIVVDTHLLKGDQHIARRLRESFERDCPGIGERAVEYWNKVAAPHLEELVVEMLGQVRPK